MGIFGMQNLVHKRLLFGEGYRSRENRLKRDHASWWEVGALGYVDYSLDTMDQGWTSKSYL